MNILVIASARQNQINDSLEILKKNYPTCNITILSFKKCPEINNIDKFTHLDLPNNTFSLLDLSKATNILKKNRFDTIFLLYNNINGNGYFNLNLLCYFIKAKRRFIFDIEKNIYPFSLYASTKKKFINILDLLWVLVLSPFFLSLIIVKKLQKKSLTKTN